MDTNNNQGNWRDQLHPRSPQILVNKIIEELKKHSHVSGQEGLLELQNIAQRFEEKNFTTATSLSDYATKISWGMLAWINSRGTTVTHITSSLDMLTLETESLATTANNMETESPATTANNMTSNDSVNGRPDQGDWRGKLQPGRREGNVNQLFDTLKRCLHFCHQDELRQLPKLAQRFEERIFTVATSQFDYAMKILLKSLKIETKLQGSLANNMMWNRIGRSSNPLDPANGRLKQGDWRGKLQSEVREKIINRIMHTLKQQLPINSSQEGSDEFGKIVRSFEEGIFTSATDKADYLSKIYLKTRALKILALKILALKILVLKIRALKTRALKIRALKTQCQDPEMNIIALKLAQLVKRNR